MMTTKSKRRPRQPEPLTPEEWEQLAAYRAKARTDDQRLADMEIDRDERLTINQYWREHGAAYAQLCEKLRAVDDYRKEREQAFRDQDREETSARLGKRFKRCPACGGPLLRKRALVPLDVETIEWNLDRMLFFWFECSKCWRPTFVAAYPGDDYVSATMYGQCEDDYDGGADGAGSGS